MAETRILTIEDEEAMCLDSELYIRRRKNSARAGKCHVCGSIRHEVSRHAGHQDPAAARN